MVRPVVASVRWWRVYAMTDRLPGFARQLVCCMLYVCSWYERWAPSRGVWIPWQVGNRLVWDTVSYVIPWHMAGSAATTSRWARTASSTTTLSPHAMLETSLTLQSRAGVLFVRAHVYVHTYIVV